MRLFELLQSFTSELGIVTAYLAQYIPIYSYGRLMEVSLSIIFATLVIYALLLPVLYIVRVFIGTILTPNQMAFPRQGDGIVVSIVAVIAVVIVIDFIRFTGGGL